MPYLHFLPTNENYPTSSYTLTAFQNCQIVTCTRRYRRSSSRFFWLQIFTDSCRQIYALAGGHTHVTVQSCADSFPLHWVARFGSPTIILTESGGIDGPKQFKALTSHTLVQWFLNLLEVPNPSSFTQALTEPLKFKKYLLTNLSPK